jgi:hypothetical protein
MQTDSPGRTAEYMMGHGAFHVFIPSDICRLEETAKWLARCVLGGSMCQRLRLAVIDGRLKAASMSHPHLRMARREQCLVCQSFLEDLIHEQRPPKTEHQ